VFAGACTPGGGVDAVVSHLLAVPAVADADGHPAAGLVVDGGQRLGGDDRITQRGEQHAGAHADPRRRGRRHGDCR